MKKDERKEWMARQIDLERIVKDESLVTCDHENCEYRGEMFWCYLNQQKRCSLYLEYMNHS